MKAKWKGALIGGIIGGLIWLWDYDFLMNPGGPNAPISSYIRSVPIIRDLSGFIFIFFPLVVLIVIGIIIGLLIVSMLKINNGRKIVNR